MFSLVLHHCQYFHSCILSFRFHFLVFPVCSYLIRWCLDGVQLLPLLLSLCHLFCLVCIVTVLYKCWFCLVCTKYASLLGLICHCLQYIIHIFFFSFYCSFLSDLFMSALPQHLHCWLVSATCSSFGPLEFCMVCAHLVCLHLVSSCMVCIHLVWFPLVCTVCIHLLCLDLSVMSVVRNKLSYGVPDLVILTLSDCWPPAW